MPSEPALKTIVDLIEGKGAPAFQRAAGSPWGFLEILAPRSSSVIAMLPNITGWKLTVAFPW